MSLISVPCRLPEFLTETTLANCFRLEEADTSGRLILVVNDLSLAFGVSEEKATICFEWSKVIYFDDCALLQLLLLQHHLLLSGYNLTHFGDISTSEATSAIITRFENALRPHLLRQLTTVGYFNIWISEDFGAAPKEVLCLSRLSAFSPLGSLDCHYEILPALACHNSSRVHRGSPEELAIRRYEEEISFRVFVSKATESMSERPVIASGEFGQLVLRQTRKNVIEHAKNRTLALSVARIVRPLEYKSDWGVRYEDLQTEIEESPLARIIGTTPVDRPILHMSTVDDGWGIHGSLGNTWLNHILEKKDSWKRVMGMIDETWPPIAVIIEFALDSDGTRKTCEERSIEQSGLSRIRGIVANYQGDLLVASGDHRIVHSAKQRPRWVRARRAWNQGAIVQMLLPIEEVSGVQKTRSRPKTAAPLSLFLPTENESPRPLSRILSIPLRDLELCTTTGIVQDIHAVTNKKEEEKEETTLALRERMCKVVAVLKERVASAGAHIRLAALDWSEVNWDEHETSSFLEELHHSIISPAGDPKLPLVFINFPEELLIQTRRAAQLFSLPPVKPLCVFLATDRHWSWRWLGISIAPELCCLNQYIDSRPAFRLHRTPETPDEQYLRHVLNTLLQGTTDVEVPCYNFGMEAAAFALKYIEASRLFEEGTTTDLSNGKTVPSARFHPCVSLDEIKTTVTETFTRAITEGLNSPACVFPPRSPESPRRVTRAKKALVRLPSGRLVDIFFRCDGLLDYAPKLYSNNSIVNSTTTRMAFRGILSDHLVDLAKGIESHAPGKIDLVVSCTSPTHWFVHQIADGLSDDKHVCGHFVAKTRSSFVQEFKRFRAKKNAKTLLFTDVVSLGFVVRTMLDAVHKAGMTVCGLIALVDSRTPQERKESVLNRDPFREIPRENQVFLVRLPIEKAPTGRATWRIDPETLEPKAISPSPDWTSCFAGIGTLGLSGQEALRLLGESGCFRHRHYKHGDRHSEYVCDVKRLFLKREARLAIGGRLSVYIRLNAIDLVVFPNHSNAYLIAEMLREFFKDDDSMPLLQVGLCRISAGERTYVLPGTELERTPKNVMILDDGIGSGATIRSLVVALLDRYPRLAEIHVVVFSNETKPGHARFWEAIGADRTIKNQKKAQSFLANKIRFTSFVSIPLPSAQEEDCVLCLRQKEFEQLARDDRRHPYERAFYRAWAEDLRPRDLYHDLDIHHTGSVDRLTAMKQNRQRSADAVGMAGFEVRLRDATDATPLVWEVASGGLATHVKIQCLRLLLSARDARQVPDAYREVRRQLQSYIESPETSRRDRLLALKAFLWEQATPPRLLDFVDLLRSACPHLGDPLVLGGVMAFARLSAPVGRELPSWTQNQMKEALRTIPLDSTDEKLCEQLNVLNDWLFGIDTKRTGHAVLQLRKVLATLPGHTRVDLRIGNFLRLLTEALEALVMTSEQVETLQNMATLIASHFSGIEEAARLLVSRHPLSGAVVDMTSVDELRSGVATISRLVTDLDDATPRSFAIPLIRKASATLRDLHSEWFSLPDGKIRLLMRPYFHRLLPSIECAIKEGREQLIMISGRKQITHNTVAFMSKEGKAVEVLCEPALLSETLLNIVSNAWKYAKPSNGKEAVEIAWTYRIEGTRLVLSVLDNGSQLSEDVDLYRPGGGNINARSDLESFSGTYIVQSKPDGGLKTELSLYCKREDV